MILTNDNYFSEEANREYMSVSQWKDFHGCLGLHGCEAMAMAKLSGSFKQEMNLALLIGSYVDAYFEGTLDQFIIEHPEVFTKASIDKGNPQLLKIYENANKMIARCERDTLFMGYMAGDKQTIFTAEMFGAKWKIKIDSYLKGVAIVDLKTSQNMRKIYSVKDTGAVNFVEYLGYIYQLAVYQKVTEIATGEHLPCFIAGVSKEKVADIEIIWIPDEYMKVALAEIEASMPMILMVKNGEVEPTSCGKCDYCKENRVLTEAIPFYDLWEDVL